jgi:peptidoglycan-N-acetylglucosamine deacetylase
MLVIAAALVAVWGGSGASARPRRPAVRGRVDRIRTSSSTGSGTAQPLPVRSASLSQDGLDVVWRLKLAQPFSPGALARDGRTLCLLIERAGNGSVAGNACLTGPARGSRAPRLIYRPITRQGPGKGRVMEARIGRSSTSDLTARFEPSQVGIAYNPLRWQVISTLRPPACEPPVPDRVGCYVLYPAKPSLVKLHTPLPVSCQPGGSSLIYNGSRNQHEVALTFDDGPWPTPPTSQFLDVLERNHAVATFFEIGDQIGSYDPGGKLERRMLADGDMIGNHTWNHPDMTRISSGSQQQELAQTQSAIKSSSGFTPCLWRPPYGAVNSGLVSLARSMGLITVVWDVDTQDWALPGTATIYQRAVSGARNGSIILQHFGGGPRYETLAAVPQEIATLRQRGYRFVTVAELLGLRLIYK